MQTAHPSESAWLDDFFASYYAHRPVNAMFIGVHELDHMLPDFSENGAGDAVSHMRDRFHPDQFASHEEADTVYRDWIARAVAIRADGEPR